jgi:hypothetical protein
LPCFPVQICSRFQFTVYSGDGVENIQSLLRWKWEGLKVLPGAAEVLPQVEPGGADRVWDEVLLEMGEEGSGLLGGGLVLDDDVRHEALPVPWDQKGRKRVAETSMQVEQGGRGKGVGDASAERS